MAPSPVERLRKAQKSAAMTPNEAFSFTYFRYGIALKITIEIPDFCDSELAARVQRCDQLGHLSSMRVLCKPPWTFSVIRLNERSATYRTPARDRAWVNACVNYDNLRESGV